MPDVEAFPGHIACSAFSKSDLVIPLRNSRNEVMAVLDIDSERMNDFSTRDLMNLEFLCHELEKQVYH